MQTLTPSSYQKMNVHVRLKKLFGDEMLRGYPKPLKGIYIESCQEAKMLLQQNKIEQGMF